jgi:hypothetical protein
MIKNTKRTVLLRLYSLIAILLQQTQYFHNLELKRFFLKFRPFGDKKSKNLNQILVQNNHNLKQNFVLYNNQKNVLKYAILKKNLTLKKFI